jgi:RloB-like protein
MGRRHDDRSIQRRRPSRQPKVRILVVCEGKKTEPLYLRQFQHHVRNPRVHVEPVGPAGVPRTVVETAIDLRRQAEDEAKRQRDENLLWDEVWAVFDMDDHPHVAEAKQLATANGIRLAVSNPCFELWALLHFVDHQAHIERDKLRATLQQHLLGYDKELVFVKLHPGYDNAVRRARELDDAAERAGRPGRNPTTGVHLLTEIIRTR